MLPLVAYTIARAVVGSATEALAITTAIPVIWLIVVAIAHRRLDPVAVIVLITTVAALGAYALTGGNALVLKLRRGAVTAPMGIAALASVALGRPLLLRVAEHAAKLNPERRAEVEARLAAPGRRRILAVLTAIIGAFFTLDGASQIALALTVPTRSFVADSTAARIVVVGTGLIITITYLRQQKQPLDRASTGPN
ncbi:MAG: VC0807 family protein [Solirubrobacteraceae bacterium]